MVIKQKISNHKELTDIEREVEINGLTLNLDLKELVFYYKINYSKGNEPIDMSSKIPDWKIDNTYTVALRDENFIPLKNPNFDPNEENSQEFLTVPAFDYFTGMFDGLAEILQGYILLDDSNGRFS